MTLMRDFYLPVCKDYGDVRDLHDTAVDMHFRIYHTCLHGAFFNVKLREPTNIACLIYLTNYNLAANRKSPLRLAGLIEIKSKETGVYYHYGVAIDNNISPLKHIWWCSPGPRRCFFEAPSYTSFIYDEALSPKAIRSFIERGESYNV